MSSFNVDISGFPNFDKVIKEMTDVVDAELEDFGRGTVAMAKELAPVDEGDLRNAITYDRESLYVEVSVGVYYAAWIEFGTRVFAVEHVSSLPPEWQTFAAQFRSTGSGGSFEEFVMRLTEWVHRKGLGAGSPGKPIGIAGTYSIKTGRRTGNKDRQAQEDRQAAYLIARSILRKGIRPHPYLQPAVEENLKQLKDRLKLV